MEVFGDSVIAVPDPIVLELIVDGLVGQDEAMARGRRVWEK